ncbi:helix-turn-helix domain-containing protein [Streptomyces sp. NBC_01643]|uniref:helix-turn-helix domain-containing protein n=1 Tax=Streptomyces sp. NBC_01643 TaxID=2975906 RepID=UPI002F91A8AC|nr:helix-turn-helix domain-containing protein [Streptomyces sp. NBC_01643]
MRARMVELSWAGARVPAIASELGYSQKTVRCWLHRFNQHGLEGLEDLGGQGRKRRITELERSRIIALVKNPPPGRLTVQQGGDLAAEVPPGSWTAGAYAAGVRSCLSKVLVSSGVTYPYSGCLRSRLRLYSISM